MGVVTSAGGDIGMAVCARLGHRGLAVLCVDRAEATAKKAADAVTSHGGVGEAFVADVTDEHQVQAYAEKACSL